MIYDGWNDVRMQLGEPQGRIAKPEMANPTLWKEHWVELCEFTNARNVKTIVTLQPFLGTGDRILSNLELAIRDTHFTWVTNDVNEYPKYQKHLDEISKYLPQQGNTLIKINISDNKNDLKLKYIALDWDIGLVNSIDFFFKKKNKALLNR